MQSAWGHTLQLFSIYFARDFKWDAGSSQFKEWCDRSQGFVARSRGLTHATIATLESQLQASIDLARNLVRILFTTCFMLSMVQFSNDYVLLFGMCVCWLRSVERLYVVYSLNRACHQCRTSKDLLERA